LEDFAAPAGDGGPFFGEFKGEKLNLINNMCGIEKT
jgi:hypothetical protein